MLTSDPLNVELPLAICAFVAYYGFGDFFKSGFVHIVRAVYELLRAAVLIVIFSGIIIACFPLLILAMIFIFWVMTGDMSNVETPECREIKKQHRMWEKSWHKILRRFRVAPKSNIWPKLEYVANGQYATIMITRKTDSGMLNIPEHPIKLKLIDGGMKDIETGNEYSERDFRLMLKEKLTPHVVESTPPTSKG